LELIDTHCHLTFEQFAGNIDDIVDHSRDAGVTTWITVGTNIEDSEKAIKLAHRFENMYAAIGIHPHYANDVNYEAISRLKDLAHDEKVVAIGETGFDFHYHFSDRPAQERLFVEHFSIAAQLNLPVIIHSREAFDDTMYVLDRFGSDVKKVAFHCFSYSAEKAQIILENGFYISLTGVVTFKNARSIQKAAEIIPLNRLMLETDCPYMSPEPLRKQKINEPALMVHTAEFIAQLKKIDLNDFANAITSTSKAFFSLPEK